MSHTDDFVFQYLLTLNFLYWPFRHLPRDKSLEQEFIKLGQKQYSTECNPEFQKLQEKSIRYQYWSSTVWEQLKLDTLKNELMKFSIAPKEILEKFGDIVPADFTPRFHCSPSNVVRVNAFEWQYFFQDKNGFYYYGILYRKQKKSKLLIPFCIGQNHHYSFWPDNLQCIFFNSGFIESADVLILTDDIACAASNQTLFWRSGNSDLAWLSWYGDMSRYPWEQLKEKKVYFLMEQHSGLNYEQMFETAIRVQEQLRAVGGPELSLIFMNPDEILGLSPYRTNIPMIINLEEWKNWTANFRIQGSDPFDYFKHKVAPRPRHSTPFGIAYSCWRCSPRSAATLLCLYPRKVRSFSYDTTKVTSMTGPQLCRAITVLTSAISINGNYQTTSRGHTHCFLICHSISRHLIPSQHRIVNICLRLSNKLSGGKTPKGRKYWS